MNLHAPDPLTVAHDAIRHARAAGADEAEAYVTHTRGATVQLQQSDIRSASTEEETTIGLRVFVGGRLGFATANTPDDLAELAAEAVALSRSAPPDPANGLPQPRAVEPTGQRADPALEAATLDELAEIAAEMLTTVRTHDPRVNVDSGAVGTEVVTSAIATSLGAAHTMTVAGASGSLFGMAVENGLVGSFDYDSDAVTTAAELRTALTAAAIRFVAKTVGALHTHKGESFRGTIILTPEVVQEFIVGNLIPALSAKAVRTGRSPFAGSLGKSIAASGFSLVDDPRRADRLSPRSFDREGQPTKKTALISDGVLASFLHDAYEARVAGVAASGHAHGGAAGLPSIGASHMRVAGGTQPFTAMCAAVPRAVLVSRFSGSTNAVSGDFSGVVKGGFLLRNGERTAIREVQIAGNLVDLIKSISGISLETRVIDGMVEVPALRVDNISITAG